MKLHLYHEWWAYKLTQLKGNNWVKVCTHLTDSGEKLRSNRTSCQMQTCAWLFTSTGFRSNSLRNFSLLLMFKKFYDAILRSAYNGKVAINKIVWAKWAKRGERSQIFLFAHSRLGACSQATKKAKSHLANNAKTGAVYYRII